MDAQSGVIDDMAAKANVTAVANDWRRPGDDVPATSVRRRPLPGAARSG